MTDISYGALSQMRPRTPREKARDAALAQSVMSRQSAGWQPEYEKEPVLEEPMFSPLDLIGAAPLAKLANLLKKVPVKAIDRTIPTNLSFKEYGPDQLSQIDEILAPWLRVGSKVNPEDRDIFMQMRKVYGMRPETRTRVMFDKETPVGAYQLSSQDGKGYLPNLAVTEQGKGYGSALMNHAIMNKENPFYLISAPGKEGFYRKFGGKETTDDISRFDFKRGGLIQMKECNRGR